MERLDPVPPRGAASSEQRAGQRRQQRTLGKRFLCPLPNEIFAVSKKFLFLLCKDKNFENCPKIFVNNSHKY